MRKKYQKKNTFSSYKEGGQTKQEWVSNKISLLIKEGKNQDQAIAQALSMAEEMFQQGGEKAPVAMAPQRPIKLIQPVSTEGWRDNNLLPPGDYQKVYYVDPKVAKVENQDYEYLNSSGYDELQRMNNYRIYMENKNKPKFNPPNNQIADEYKEGGELPQYQVAGTTNLAWQMTPPESNTYPGIAPQNQNLFFKQQPTAQEWATQFAPVQKVTTQPTAVKPPVVATPTRPQIQPIDSSLMSAGLTYGTPAEQLQTSAARAVADIPSQQQEQVTTTDVKPQPFQFINPGGVSLETAANLFGQGLANKDAFGIVAGGSKLLTGLGRNILSPYASNVASNRVNARAAEDMRDSITRTGNSQTLTDQGWNQGLGYYQEGGEMTNEVSQEQMLMQVAQALQQGAAPEEVMQQLIASGLDEQTAAQMIEMVMQELQAQAPPAEEQPMMQEGGTLDTLKGKRIVDYKLNPSTGKYTVTYED